MDVLLAQTQVPSEHWAKLATRGLGQSVTLLSALPTCGRGLQRWADTTKWCRTWCADDAIAEAEIRIATAMSRRAQQHVRGGRCKGMRLVHSGQEHFGHPCKAMAQSNANLYHHSACSGHGCAVCQRRRCDTIPHEPAQSEVVLDDMRDRPLHDNMDNGIDSKSRAQRQERLSESSMLATDEGLAGVGCEEPSNLPADGELRRDPESKGVLSFLEFRQLYMDKYSLAEIVDYWHDACTPSSKDAPTNNIETDLEPESHVLVAMQ